MFIRIIATPPGEAPEEVRREWIGLDLPLVAGETGPRTVPVGGVLTGARTPLAILVKLLTGQRQYQHGYVIDAPQALVLLADKAPWAAQWWRDCAPHCWEPGRKFLFPAEVCAPVAGGAIGRPSAPARTSSEEIFAAGRAEVTAHPGHKSPSEQVQKSSQPDPGRGPVLRSDVPPRQSRQPVQRLVDWLAWLGCGFFLVLGARDWITDDSSGIGWRVFFPAAAVPLLWRWSIQRTVDRSDR
jgi:hypothetical protein